MAMSLLEWQPVVHLQHENYQLREENRFLHSQVRDLAAWKEKAVKHLVTMAPKRSKAQREIRHAQQLQKQLQGVEQSLQEREALMETTKLLEEKETLLLRCVEKLELEKKELHSKADSWRQRQEKTAQQLDAVNELFRCHLETLVAIRQRLAADADDAGDNNNNESPDSPASGLREEKSDDASAKQQETKSLSTPVDNNNAEDAIMHMIEGLRAVSETCLRWLHDHAAQTSTWQVQRMAKSESQDAELEMLRDAVQLLEQERQRSTMLSQQQTQQILQLQQATAQLSVERTQLESVLVVQTRGQSHTSDQVRLLVAEIRQYLRVVRVEIKKKFGYVPETIAHAHNWTRILDALDVLERNNCDVR